MTRPTFCSVPAAMTLMLLCTAGATAQSAGFTYQGQLKQAGSPYSGDADLAFTLWDADADGAQVAGPVSLPATAISGGLFTVPLDFGMAAFDGSRRWLEVTVNATVLSPRQEVTPAPYAMFAMRPWATSGADISYASGNVGIGTTTPTQMLSVAGTIESTANGFMFPDGSLQTTASTSGPGFWTANGADIYNNNGGYVGIGTSSPAAPLDVVGTAKMDGFLLPTGAVEGYVLTSDASGSGTWQAAPAGGFALPYSGSADVPSPDATFKLTNTDSSNGTTLWCQTEGTNGIGVYSSANATTGFAYGGIFQSASTDGRGVRAEALATSGLAIGGRFSSASTTGIGVWSTASAASGLSYGVYGDSLSTAGIGVRGQASASSGSTVGVHGLNYSTAGIGVRGEAIASTGFAYGGDFSTNSTDGRGVRGAANASTGLAIGGRFGSASTSGIGVWSTASATSGVNYGVYGDSLSPSGYGGYFRNSASGTALWADGLAKVKTLQILGGADLAEPFNVNADAGTGPVQSGMVVVIDESHPGELRLTDRPYDTRVAGVISGANGLAPGMVMKAEGMDKADGAHPVAMTGRVWCYVDASFGAINPGDRLTSSATPGYAMKADDAARCGGAVIGKAMSALPQGERGLVLVLVNLQ